jgi:hypothetical protein
MAERANAASIFPHVAVLRTGEQSEILSMEG